MIGKSHIMQAGEIQVASEQEEQEQEAAAA